MARIAQVLIPMPLPEAFDYAEPEGMGLAAGDLVAVPLGPRLLRGVVVGLRDAAGVNRPLKAVDNTLSLDLEGVDDVAFHATPEQVSAWSKAKKAGALKLVVVFKPNGDRCAGSAAAEAWRLGGKVRSWEIVGEKGVVASADAEGDPVSGAPKVVKVEKVSVESDAGPADDDGRSRLSGAQHLLDKCVTGASRGGSVLLAFSVQGGRVHEPQVIMDSLRDEKVTACVAHAVNGAEVGGTGRGSAAISLE